MKRKIMILLLGGALSIGLAACSSGEAESVAGAAAELLGGSSSEDETGDMSEEEEDYSLEAPEAVKNLSAEEDAKVCGEMKDNVYTNEFFGCRFVSPKGWKLHLYNTGEEETAAQMPTLQSSYDEGYGGIWLVAAQEDEYVHTIQILVKGLADNELGKSESEVVDLEVEKNNETYIALGDEPVCETETLSLFGEAHPAKVRRNSETGGIDGATFYILNGDFVMEYSFNGEQVGAELTENCMEKI